MQKNTLQVGQKFVLAKALSGRFIGCGFYIFVFYISDIIDDWKCAFFQAFVFETLSSENYDFCAKKPQKRTETEVHAHVSTFEIIKSVLILHFLTLHTVDYQHRRNEDLSLIQSRDIMCRFSFWAPKHPYFCLKSHIKSECRKIRCTEA